MTNFKSGAQQEKCISRKVKGSRLQQMCSSVSLKMMACPSRPSSSKEIVMEWPPQNSVQEGKCDGFLPRCVNVATQSCKHGLTGERKRLDPEIHHNHPNAASTFLFILLFSIQFTSITPHCSVKTNIHT